MILFRPIVAAEIIHEIDSLPPAEKTKVVRYARELPVKQPLSGAELGKLAQQMVDATDPSEVERLKTEIIKGFYGDE